jgi:DNA-directed RNA polymerase specialized sigma24 family protein
MSGESAFLELIRRLRGGDQQAVKELISKYTPLLTRTALVRLRNTALQRVLGASDVVQAVFLSFCIRVQLGQYELNGPQDLFNLLMKMTHNKLTAQKRHHEAECRDLKRNGRDAAEVPVASTGPTPSEAIVMKELMAMARHRMSDEEWQLGELHKQGLEWGQIAERMGGTAEGRRKQLERAVKRVGTELNLVE